MHKDGNKKTSTESSDYHGSIRLVGKFIFKAEEAELLEWKFKSLDY